jgi:hypothetical protein
MNFAALDVAIGLALVYLLLSMICSLLQEGISARLQMRAKTLETGIVNLLSSQKLTLGGIDLSAAIYAHPLVKALAPAGQKPSYIPSRTFARALLDLVHQAAGTDGSAPALLQAVQALPDGDTKTALMALAHDAYDGVSQARRNIEHWFDDAMDRVGGWYKRQAQKIMLGIGLALAVGLNVDTTQIARALWRDPVLRQAAVAQAEVAAHDTTTPDIAALRGRLQGLDLPLGWPPMWGQDGYDRRVDLAFAIVGWILTAAAISLGAPFWFDALNKLLNLRSAGVRPERSNGAAPPAT